MEYLGILNGVSFKEGAAFAILAIAIVMILRGDLVPKSLMSERITDKDFVINSQEETIKRLVDTNNKLLAESSVTIKLLSTMNSMLGGEDDAVETRKETDT